MALEGAIRPDDQVVEAGGIKFVIDPHAAGLGAVRIDFDEGPYGGFSILSDRFPSSGNCG